jgi:glutamyl-tRNA synthetase
MDFKISHVVRGEDHVTNTAIQIQIFQALGATPPSFAHHSLIKSKEGKLSKRVGGFDIGSLRAEGIQPMAITSLLARLGTSDPVELRHSIEDLIAHFNISRFTKAAANYDVEDLKRLNTRLIQSLDFNSVKETLPSGADEAFWLSVRNNIESLEEVREWWNICCEPLTPEIEDAEFTQEASALLPDGTWNEHTWNEWIEAIKTKTGRKGKLLFMPLRKALTAREHGPELQYMLPLIGPEKAKARLSGKSA